MSGHETLMLNVNIHINWCFQMEQIVCKRGMCIENAELTFYNQTVTVVPKTHAYVSKRKSRSRTIVEVSLDGTKVSHSTSITLDRGCVMRVSKQRRNKYTVTVTDVGLRVTFTGRYGALRVVTKLNDTSCCDEILKGLCGNCGACSGNTLTLPQCPLMQAGYSDGDDTGIVNVDASTKGKTLDEMIEGTIVHTDDPVTGGAGRCICFTDSTAVTNEITLFAGRYTTIEFLLRTCAADRCHGTVLSFSGSQTFALLHQDTLKIVHGDNFVYDSGVTLPDNKWTFISIVLDNKKRHGKLHIFADGVKFAVMKEFWYYDKVTGNCFIGMGRWQLSNDGTFLNEIDHFVGCVDQLRIWHRSVVFVCLTV